MGSILVITEAMYGDTPGDTRAWRVPCMSATWHNTNATHALNGHYTYDRQALAGATRVLYGRYMYSTWCYTGVTWALYGQQGQCTGPTTSDELVLYGRSTCVTWALYGCDRGATGEMHIAQVLHCSIHGHYTGATKGLLERYCTWALYGQKMGQQARNSDTARSLKGCSTGATMCVYGHHVSVTLTLHGSKIT